VGLPPTSRKEINTKYYTPAGQEINVGDITYPCGAGNTRSGHEC